MPVATEMQPLSNDEVVALAEREGPDAALWRLVSNRTFTDEQKDKLLDLIKVSPNVCSRALETLSWLNEDQRKKLRGKTT